MSDSMNRFITNAPDQDIVRQVLDGDKSAFEPLFERYQYLVYHRALMILRDCDKAEDVVQDVFLAVYKNLDRLKEPAHFGSWVAAITRNTCMNLLRKEKKKAISLDDLKEIGIEPDVVKAGTKQKNERVLAVKQCIAKLAGKYREILEMKYSRDMSCKRIAGFLDVPVSTVKSRLFYARKKVIKMLKKEGAL